jgi:hypothetical protein
MLGDERVYLGGETQQIGEALELFVARLESEKFDDQAFEVQ